MLQTFPPLLELKKASLGDAEELCFLQTEAFQALLETYQDHLTNPATETREKMTKRLDMPNRDVYFITLHNKNIGFLIIANNVSECVLIRIGILPAYQNKGYAQQAIMLAESLYPNAKTWKLDTIKQEKKLCHLYEKLGYQKTGEQKNLKEGMDLVYFSRKI